MKLYAIRDNRTLEENALSITLSKTLDDAGSEYDDQTIKSLTAYYREVKAWLESPVTRRLREEIE